MHPQRSDWRHHPQPKPIYLSLKALFTFPVRLCNPPPAVGKVRSLGVTPVFEVKLEDVLNRRHLPPLGLKDFEEWLLFAENSPENLYFVLWLKEYTKRYNEWIAQSKGKFKPTHSNSYSIPSVSSEDECHDEFEYHVSPAPAPPSAALSLFYQRAKQTFLTPNAEYELQVASDILAPFHTTSSPSTPKVPAFGSSAPLTSATSNGAYSHPDPAVFAELSYFAHKALKESLDRFVKAAYSNVGSSRAYCGTAAGGVLALGGFFPVLLVSFLHDWTRWARLASLPALWASLTIVVTSLQGLCIMIYLFGDFRQLRKFELARPAISKPQGRQQQSQSLTVAGGGCVNECCQHRGQDRRSSVHQALSTVQGFFSTSSRSRNSSVCTAVASPVAPLTKPPAAKIAKAAEPLRTPLSPPPGTGGNSRASSRTVGLADEEETVRGSPLSPKLKLEVPFPSAPEVAVTVDSSVNRGRPPLHSHTASSSSTFTSSSSSSHERDGDRPPSGDLSYPRIHVSQAFCDDEECNPVPADGPSPNSPYLTYVRKGSVLGWGECGRCEGTNGGRVWLDELEGFGATAGFISAWDEEELDTGSTISGHSQSSLGSRKSAESEFACGGESEDVWNQLPVVENGDGGKAEKCSTERGGATMRKRQKHKLDIFDFDELPPRFATKGGKHPYAYPTPVEDVGIRIEKELVVDSGIVAVGNMDGRRPKPTYVEGNDETESGMKGVVGRLQHWCVDRTGLKKKLFKDDVELETKPATIARSAPEPIPAKPSTANSTHSHQTFNSQYTHQLPHSLHLRSRSQPEPNPSKRWKALRAVPTFKTPLTKIWSPVITRAQWEIVTRSGLTAFLACLVIGAVLIAIPGRW
ncbi:hypothetical protein JAAARDRAFT_30306 [Jaapia argillacea MUCL 33604]|uniref:RGS domain-containing protein n=1 Tax=Jaapia argillacea MUCL 33604 TaxID=933084 RepID=A0A067Q5Y6_9AGAM|nr:hypothetical protein JAAARDRAFT_30306 [Jaapia argillacea MUCL 33604]